MDKKIKIARQLVRIARSLMASGFSEYERERLWYTGDETWRVIDSFRQSNDIEVHFKQGGIYDLYIEETNKNGIGMTCNVEIREVKGNDGTRVISMTASNFYKSYYDDDYGHSVDEKIPAHEIGGLNGLASDSFVFVSDQDTADRVKSYVDGIRGILAGSAC